MSCQAVEYRKTNTLDQAHNQYNKNWLIDIKVIALFRIEIIVLDILYLGYISILEKMLTYKLLKYYHFENK